ncbi:acetate--CoA ligase family protein [Natrialbaceae archaeon A-CW1-1]
MSRSYTCPVFRPADCQGAPECPPRCPRYVAEDGTSYTIYPVATAPVSPAEIREYLSLETLPVGLEADNSPGVSQSGDPTDFVAITDGVPVGLASYDRSAASTSVTVAGDADTVAGTELCRHVIANGVDSGEKTVTLEAPPPSLRRIGREYRDALLRREPQSVTIDLECDAATRATRVPTDRADIAAPQDLSSLVDPVGVAVVGATDREDAIGRLVFENLRETYGGRLVPVTPTHETVGGVPAVDSLEALDGDAISLAVVVLPPEPALDAVDAAGRAGIEAVAVLSAGFGETDGGGTEREETLCALVDRHNLTLIGPNSLGVLSTRNGLNASFAPTFPDAGTVSVLSHSGAMITSILDWAQSEGLGTRDVVSLGNTAGIDEAALVRYWGADPDTDVIVAYLEDVADGQAFVEAAREVGRSTPIVALKSGHTDAGSRAAASHTGALVGDDSGFEAAFDAAGIRRVPSQQALFDLTRAFAQQPIPRGDRVAVVTNAGGPGVLAADALSAAGLTLASLDSSTRERLHDGLPSAASASNPVDVLGDADVARFQTALDVVLGDGCVDAVLVTTTPHPLVDPSSLATAIGETARRHGKPVLSCFSGGPLEQSVDDALLAAGIPNYSDATRAAETIASMVAYDRFRRRPYEPPEPVDADRGTATTTLAGAQLTDWTTIGVEGMSILEAYGVPTPQGCIVEDGAEAQAAAVAMGGVDRVALKIVSPDIPHKTDVGGVAIDVPLSAVESTCTELLETVRATVPEARIRGVQVQEMAPDGVECLVGVTRHPRFGPLVTFGTGGILVEQQQAVDHALAPLSRADARTLVDSSPVAPLLEGVRGQEPADTTAVVDALVRLSWIAADHPELSAFEVNPLVAAPEGVFALDFVGELEDGR